MASNLHPPLSKSNHEGQYMQYFPRFSDPSGCWSSKTGTPRTSRIASAQSFTMTLGKPQRISVERRLHASTEIQTLKCNGNIGEYTVSISATLARNDPYLSVSVPAKFAMVNCAKYQEPSSSIQSQNRVPNIWNHHPAFNHRIAMTCHNKKARSHIQNHRSSILI